MSEAYEAIIFGRRRQVLGWTADGHLQLAGGRLELEFVDVKPVGKIHRIASYKEQLLHTSIDGQWFCPQDLPGLRYAERMTITAAMAAFCSYPPIVRHEIVAVAWSSDANGRPHVFCLTRCEEIKPAAQSSQTDDSVQTIGRLKYTPDFNDVWFDGVHYDLRTRAKARHCLRFLIEKRAFAQEAACHLETEIDPYVRTNSGNLPRAADIRIHHYFTDTKDKRKRLEQLRKKLIHAAGRNGRFYLKVN